MSQFDIYENTNKQSSEQFPFLIEVRSDVFESSTRSVYVPLVLSNALTVSYTHLTLPTKRIV